MTVSCRLILPFILFIIDLYFSNFTRSLVEASNTINILIYIYIKAFILYKRDYRIYLNIIIKSDLSSSRR